MAELGGGFYDQLKSISSGYANFDYEEGEMRPADLVRLDLLVNGNPIDALARVVHRLDPICRVVSYTSQNLAEQSYDYTAQSRPLTPWRDTVEV